MTSEDVIPDRELLRAEAVRRTRRLWWFVAVMAALLVLVPAVMLATGLARVGSGGIVVAFLPAFLGIVAGAIVLYRLRRHDHGGDLSDGATREDHRAIQRALRTGRAPDARIDALTRETAARNLRNRWLPILFGVLLAIQLVLLTIDLVSGDGAWLPAVLSVLWVANLAGLLVMRNRSRRYLNS